MIYPQPHLSRRRHVRPPLPLWPVLVLLLLLPVLLLLRQTVQLALPLGLRKELDGDDIAVDCAVPGIDSFITNFLIKFHQRNAVRK